ncbi:MAG TPA: cytochrome c, partial [Phnomibacter sp.]|nr:cytochrome c [Phnomibacter sp.]
MTKLRFISRVLPASLFLVVTLGMSAANAQDGKALFNANCASCHKIDKDLTGPALLGVQDRWPSKDLLKLWIKNWNAAVATGDPYAVKMKDWAPSAMNQFPNLSDADVEAILTYIKDWKPPVPVGPVGDGGNAKPAADNSLLFGIVTLILALIALILLQVNSNLRKLSDDKQGIKSPEPVPFWKSKTYLAFGTVAL